jgi:hypothetical protein
MRIGISVFMYHLCFELSKEKAVDESTAFQNTGAAGRN